MKNRDTFSQDETRQRFEAALRGARLASPKMLKDKPRKAAESNQPKKKPAKASS